MTGSPKIARGEIDASILTTQELSTDGTVAATGLSALTVVSVTSGTKTIVLSGTFLLDDPDNTIEVGYKVTLAGNAAAGSYTVATVVDDTTLTVVEAIVTASGGTATFYYPEGALQVGFASVTPLSMGVSTVADALNLLKRYRSEWFALGTDGNVTISGSTTLVRDMYYGTLTLAAGAALNPAGFVIYADTVDLSNAPAGAIAANGTAGNNGTAGGTGGAVVSASGFGTIGTNTDSGQGGTDFANQPAGAGTAGSSTNCLGGGSGAGGAGGNGTFGNGGAGAGAHARRALSFLRPITNCLIPLHVESGVLESGYIQGGASGSGGGAGGSTTTTPAGGGGGGGGTGGRCIVICARKIIRGASTVASCIQAKGATGGNGGTPASGNSGGGGGGAGGGGGWVYLLCEQLSGSSAANAIDVSGGAGGNGGTKTGTGTNGAGAVGGDGGTVTVLQVSSFSATETLGGAGSAASGQTGGAGATFRVSL